MKNPFQWPKEKAAEFESFSRFMDKSQKSYDIGLTQGGSSHRNAPGALSAAKDANAYANQRTDSPGDASGPGAVSQGPKKPRSRRN
jgi:hypothetical protein